MWKFLVCIFTIVFLLAGCIAPSDPMIPYLGEHQELAATAIYSIPGVKSNLDDQILLLEEDAFGRVMFLAYLEDGILGRKPFADNVLALVIMQKQDESNVYFYGERNYLFRFVRDQFVVTHETASEYFESNAIEQLKKENHWNLPPDASAGTLVAAPLALEKETSLTNEARQTLKEAFGNNMRYQFFREDQNGNKMYMILVINGGDYKWYLTALNQEGRLANDDAIQEINLQNENALSDTVENFVTMHRSH